MRDHVRILVCGDDGVGKSTFIGTLIARNFAHEVPAVMSDVHIPPEENEDEVFCTITDSSALPRDRQQLVEKMRSAESVLVLYDVQRPETLAHLDTFWLPLIEAHAKDVPVVVVRNKMDTLVEEGGLGEHRSVDLERQMEPLERRYKSFHVSIECSSVTQMGINQAFYHGRIAALYPRAPLYDAQEEKLRPRFDRALRRLFRIYDADRDGLLDDGELNAFQYQAFKLNLSEDDHNVLRRILERLAAERGQDVETFVKRPRPNEGVPGGFTVEGFLRLIQLFIDKKQMKAPWQAMTSHHYDEDLVLTLPPEVSDPPPGKATGRYQVLAQPAQKFLLQLFQQFSRPVSSTTAGEQEGRAEAAAASPARLLTEEGQAEVFSVVPDPTCAPWDAPASSRSQLGSSSQEDSGRFESATPFARLRRPPGVTSRALTEEGWMAHWQMLALQSPLLLRSHLFYVGFNGHAEDMLVDKGKSYSSTTAAAAATTATATAAAGVEAPPRRSGRGRRTSAVIEVFVLGRRGCGKTRLIKALRLGDDLRSHSQQSSSGDATSPAGDDAVSPDGADTGGDGDGDGDAPSSAEQPESQDEAKEEGRGQGVETAGAGGGESGGEGWEMVVDPEVPETCCGFARLGDAGATTGSGSAAGAGVPGSPPSASSSASPSPRGCLSVTVTEVPESYTDAFMGDQVSRCDLALLAFDPSSRESLDFVAPLLADIPPDVPRLLLACESSREADPSVLRAAEDLCEELELSRVVVVDPATGKGLEGDGQLRQKITDPVCKGMLPFEERHRKANRNRKIYIAVAALAVAAGLIYAVSSSSMEQSAAAAANMAETGRGGGGGDGLRSSGGSWEAGVGGALRAPLRAAKRAAAAAADYWRRWRSGRAGGMVRDGGGEAFGGYVGAVGSL